MTAALRVAEYHATVYRRIWRGSVATVLIGPVLYLVAMGIGVGALIDDNTDSGLDIPYIEFVAPASWPRRRCRPPWPSRCTRCSAR